MKLIIGLGNPGKEYKNNRHNVGFMILDSLYKKYKDNFSLFKEDRKMKAEVSIGEIEGQKIILAKPLTFMNNSGISLTAIMNFYKIKLEDILVIQDDKDLEFCKIRIKDESSAGGHNGIKSIISAIGTNEIKRFKFGVANEKLDFMETDKFVLEDFSGEEKKKINEQVDDIIEDVLKNI